MKKIFKLNNLGWIVAGILFLILLSRIFMQDKIIPQNRVEIIPTKILVPTVKQETVEVVRIVDGDTVIVRISDEEKSIRLIGIDSPEKNECFEKEATKKAKELMENKKIKLEADTSQDDKDKYDRLLRYIYLEDGTLVNKKLIEEGMAKEYTYKVPYKFQTGFKEAEKTTKENKMGMWADGACLKF